MTAHKHFKQLVRTRMQKTGEGYATARRQIIQQSVHPAGDPALRWHFPGNIPATTALRVLLAHAGVRAPHNGEPFSEAMLFGIAGGIGTGVFTFVYEKENFASFFVAGRHSWQDDLAYTRQICGLLDIQPTVSESAGAKAAEKHLRETLGEHGPCMAWVDMALLPHRAMPAFWSGGGYHVITIYRLQDDAEAALIGDLADDPITIPLVDLAAARARIKKQKHRLFSIPQSASPQNLQVLVRSGLRICHRGLVSGRMRNFHLDALRVWGERLHGSEDRESWQRIFPRGSRLWRGLVSICDFIEHYGTGGGLCRPLFADFLREAAAALGDARLTPLAERYAQLGRGWSALADAALPDSVPMLREARQLCARKAELTLSGGSPEDIRELWQKLDELALQAGQQFPLTDVECDEIRAGLQRRVLALHEAEVAAAGELAGRLED